MHQQDSYAFFTSAHITVRTLDAKLELARCSDESYCTRATRILWQDSNHAGDPGHRQCPDIRPGSG
jgi:hypothetical protein